MVHSSKFREALVLFAPQIFFHHKEQKEAQRKMQSSRFKVESSRLMVDG